MSTETMEETPVEISTEITLADFAMFFELEYTLVKAREFFFGQVSELLAGYKKKITVPEFSRYCLFPAPKYFVPRLIEAFGLPEDKESSMAADLDKAYAEYVVSADVAVNPTMKALIEAALAKGLPVCGLSALSLDSSTKMLKQLGLADKGIELFCCDDIDSHFPRADTWMKMARELAKSARRCVVFASSSRACKATLSAGMRSVALPDEYTEFQDFGGAEMILEGEVNAVEIVDYLYPIDAKA